jgi:putative flavoprotein involved in K+ transport
MHQADHIDTVIVGGGQTGLAMSYHLRQRGREHVILERRRVAERWRTERWIRCDSSCRTGGLSCREVICGSRPGGICPSFGRFALRPRLRDRDRSPVRTGIEVTSLSRDEDSGYYSLETADGQIKHGMLSSPPVRFSADDPGL